jgi:hypothetical protein
LQKEPQAKTGNEKVKVPKEDQIRTGNKNKKFKNSIKKYL